MSSCRPAGKLTSSSTSGPSELGDVLGNSTRPASRSGDTPSARATFDPSGLTGTIGNALSRFSAWIADWPAAASSTRITSGFHSAAAVRTAASNSGNSTFRRQQSRT